MYRKNLPDAECASLLIRASERETVSTLPGYAHQRRARGLPAVARGDSHRRTPGAGSHFVTSNSPQKCTLRARSSMCARRLSKYRPEIARGACSGCAPGSDVMTLLFLPTHRRLPGPFRRRQLVGVCALRHTRGICAPHVRAAASGPLPDSARPRPCKGWAGQRPSQGAFPCRNLVR